MEEDKNIGLPRDATGRISAIRLETSGRVKRAAVYVDDRLAIYALPGEVADLATGEAVHREQLRRLQERYQRGAYLQAIRFLARRDRSVREVQQHLRDKGWDAAACEQAVNRLRQEQFLDDRAFARKWVDYRARTAPRSRGVMMRELEQKGIDRQIIGDAVAAMDEAALALACAQKKIRQWQRYDGSERRQRIMVFLQRKGFPYAICRKTAHRMLEDGQGD
jgi:regulatory protein